MVGCTHTYWDTHLFIGVMLKTEIFDILLHGEIGVGEVAVLLHGEIVVGEVAVGEISDWGSCAGDLT